MLTPGTGSRFKMEMALNDLRSARSHHGEVRNSDNGQTSFARWCGKTNATILPMLIKRPDTHTSDAAKALLFFAWLLLSLLCCQKIWSLFVFMPSGLTPQSECRTCSTVVCMMQTLPKAIVMQLSTCSVFAIDFSRGLVQTRPHDLTPTSVFPKLIHNTLCFFTLQQTLVVQADLLSERQLRGLAPIEFALLQRRCLFPTACFHQVQCFLASFFAHTTIWILL